MAINVTKESVINQNCAPVALYLFLFLLWEISWSENRAGIIEGFNSTSRYLDDLLNIDNIYFDQIVEPIYPTELQLNRTNSSNIEAPFLDLNLCISNDTVFTKIYDTVSTNGTILILILSISHF